MNRARSQFRKYLVLPEAQPVEVSRFGSRQASHAALHGLWLALLLALAMPARAQLRPDPSTAPPYQQTGIAEQERELENFPTNDPVEKARRLRAYNAARQKALVADTNKLLRLAKELEDEVSRANPDSFTAAQLRKMAEIEKLARSVRQKMTTTAPGAQEFPHSYSPEFR
jgi:hypothetical protein